jgi:hypothetical protein
MSPQGRSPQGESRGAQHEAASVSPKRRPEDEVRPASPEPTTSGDVAAVTPDKEQPSAAQRLAESRERLREWMLRGDGRHQARRRNAAAQAEGVEPSRLDRLRAMPVIGIVIDAVTAWWSQHPLNMVAGFAEGGVRDAVAPLVRRHPIAIVAVAFAAGSALGWFRPWRLIKPALIAGIVSQITSRLIAQIPLDSLLASFAAFAHDRSRHDSEDEVPAPAPSPHDTPAPVAERELESVSP